MENLEDLWQWAESHTNLEKKPDPTKRAYRLDRMFYLLSLLGDPHKKIPAIHIAGSKGKGSTATFISHILSQKGKKVGLYRSPHLTDYRERITLNTQFYPESIYLQAGNQICQLLKKVGHELVQFGGPATTFEILTLMAFLIFSSENHDFMVLETGLGGRLDATNCVSPLAAVLTRIELEHTEILGNSLSEIAREKAGIIKPLTPTFSQDQNQEVRRVFFETCQKQNAPFFEMNEEVSIKWDPESFPYFQIRWVGFNFSEAFTIPLVSKIQCSNFLFCLYILLKLKLINPVDLNPLFKSLEGFILPGRFQSWGSRVILDGAHTKESVAVTADSFRKLFGGKGILVFGAFDKKDLLGMAQVLQQGFSKIILCPPGFSRPTNLEDLQKAFDMHPAVESFSHPLEAFKEALKQSEPILICGSFYLVGEFLKYQEELKPLSTDPPF